MTSISFHPIASATVPSATIANEMQDGRPHRLRRERTAQQVGAPRQEHDTGERTHPLREVRDGNGDSPEDEERIRESHLDGPHLSPLHEQRGHEQRRPADRERRDSESDDEPADVMDGELDVEEQVRDQPRLDEPDQAERGAREDTSPDDRRQRRGGGNDVVDRPRALVHRDDLAGHEERRAPQPHEGRTDDAEGGEVLASGVHDDRQEDHGEDRYLEEMPEVFVRGADRPRLHLERREPEPDHTFSPRSPNMWR